MIESLPGERWLPIPGWEALYLVSDYGRVYSKTRLVPCGTGTTLLHGRLLKPFLAGGKPGNRYLSVNLHHGGARKTRRIHKLVLAAFVGPCPEGMDGLHWDDDRMNNHLDNLRYGTHSENMRDKVRNGRHPMAARTECKWGHEYTPENTLIHKLGHRLCRQCGRDKVRKQRAARKEAA